MSSVKISELQNLRERIMRYRAQTGLSQSEFAKKCGLTRPTIGAIESGGYRPGRSTISEISMFKIVTFLESVENYKDKEDKEQKAEG